MQSLGKERMIAIPRLISFEGLEEQPGAGDPLEDLLAVTPSHDSIAERSRQPGEQAGLEQKSLHLLRLDRKHFCPQIVLDLPLVPTEACEHLLNCSRLSASRESQREQTQPRHPAFQARVEIGYQGSREKRSVIREPLLEEQVCFLGREREIAHSHI